MKVHYNTKGCEEVQLSLSQSENRLYWGKNRAKKSFFRSITGSKNRSFLQLDDVTGVVFGPQTTSFARF